MKKRERVLLYFFSALLVLVLPIYANPMQPTMTEVFITQNGIPVDDSVDFSLDCYGSVVNFPGPIDLSRYGIKEVRNLTGDNDAVYTYAATCRPAESCIVHKPDMPWLLRISHCDLSGIYKGQTFLLKNFSTSSMMASEKTIRSLSGNHEEAFALTQEAWTICSDQRRENEKTCDKFVIKGASDIVNESGIFRTDLGPDYWQCRNNTTQEIFSCIRKNGKMLNSAEAEDSNIYYELRFDIPSDNKTTGTKTTIQRSPVESLYCSIINFFGASC